MAKVREKRTGIQQDVLALDDVVPNINTIIKLILEIHGREAYCSCGRKGIHRRFGSGNYKAWICSGCNLIYSRCNCVGGPREGQTP